MLALLHHDGTPRKPLIEILSVEVPSGRDNMSKDVLVLYKPIPWGCFFEKDLATRRIRDGMFDRGR
jgi:hypothetical protein